MDSLFYRRGARNSDEMEFAAELRYEKIGSSGPEQCRLSKKAQLTLDTENGSLMVIMPVGKEKNPPEHRC